MARRLHSDKIEAAQAQKPPIADRFGIPPAVAPVAEDTRMDAIRGVTAFVNRGQLDIEAAREVMEVLGLLDSGHGPNHPLTIPCAECGAGPRQRCRSERGLFYSGKYHTGRRRAGDGRPPAVQDITGEQE